MNDERVRAAALADSFAGLPAGVTHLELWDRLNGARCDLGLNSNELWLLGYYIKRTRANDWAPGNQPVVAWPKFEVCFDSGWSEDTLSRVERGLCAKGLIAFRDSSNCKRRAFRTRDGGLPENASGISLAPLGARAEEIYALAFQHTENKRKLASLYRALFDARVRARSLQKHPDLPGSIKTMIHNLLAELPARKDPAADITVITALLEKSQDILRRLGAMIGLPEERQVTAAASADGGTATLRRRLHRPRRDVSPRPASLPHMHRKIAERKDPESKQPMKDKELLSLLMAAPETFRATLEVAQERSGSNAWEIVLNDAIDDYGRNLSVNRNYIGKLRRQFGIKRTVKALFCLGRMAENGADIRNPAGYARHIASMR
ncbi:helix-turn-helix domain-containing protein [Paracoccus sp. 1_MG-2023]|uniref:helix-turn-helix domain-containing protein n=1 Tax=unclassified Paracoccus (in: a-proteobacteria) TaxID=2688777 RepID=UPI001C0A307A|nr:MULTISPECIES: helix-turn-helix domain-containing protein [unclassified Paracoccus (in: a-proteobacteria)]MBU2959143.1 hypothetical protein [Paracoccus sp. C2R09]MDO6669426.1 helix-turn-helix domain-containing protein [Paracoccus sp. 1_MG-2023]